MLGGGFGGLHTARASGADASRRDPSVEITLVSRDNFFLYTPMLHEIASCEIDITHIVSPIRTLLRRTNVFIGDVEAIDLTARRVRVCARLRARTRTNWSTTISSIALGSITNFYGLPGLESHALTMKTLGDAIHLRNRVIATLEEADTECAGERRWAADDGRGGRRIRRRRDAGRASTTSCAKRRASIRTSIPARIRMVLVHSGPVILPELGEHLGAYAQAKLLERGLEIVTNARVAGGQPRRRHAERRTAHPARLRRVDGRDVAASAPRVAALSDRQGARHRGRDAARARLGRRLVARRLRRRAGSASPESRILRPRSTRCARRKTVAANIVATLRGKHAEAVSTSARSVSWRRSDDGPASRASSASTSPDSSRGGCGAPST